MTTPLAFVALIFLLLLNPSISTSTIQQTLQERVKEQASSFDRSSDLLLCIKTIRYVDFEQVSKYMKKEDFYRQDPEILESVREEGGKQDKGDVSEEERKRLQEKTERINQRKAEVDCYKADYGSILSHSCRPMLPKYSSFQ